MRVTQSIGQGLLLDYPIVADAQVEHGYMVAINAAGFAADAATGSKKVVGIADETMSNIGGSNGDQDVRVVTGRVFRLNNDGLTLANVGDTVGIVDRETVGPLGAGVPVGVMTRFISDDEVWVWIPVGGMGL